jgi:hypothetical protein
VTDNRLGNVDLVALLVDVGVRGHGDRDDLGVKVTRVARLHGPGLRDHGPLVLLLTGDVAALGDVLGGQAYRDVDVVQRALRAVERGVLVLVADRGAGRGARDGLDAGRDVLVALAGLDRVGGHPDRHQRGGTEAVDRAAGHVMVEPREQRSVAPDVVALLAGPRCGAHQDVVGVREVDPGIALDQLPDRNRRQLIGSDCLQRASEGAPDGRADGVDDHCFWHVGISSSGVVTKTRPAGASY